MGSCPKCGAAAAPDHAFCGECGTAVLPVVLRHDRSRVYDSGIETTLDLRLEGAIEGGSIDVSSPSLEAPLSREIAGPEICLPGFRPPKKTDALILAVKILAEDFAVEGEFKIRIRRRTTARTVVKIEGDKNIVDLARFGGVEEPPPPEADWVAVPLRRSPDFIPRGTPLAVGEQTLAFPVSFGRKRETNQVVVRVPGDDARSVQCIGRNHFRLSLSRGAIVLTNVSHAGTSVNGRAVEKETALRDGDTISLAGAAEFRLSLEREGDRVTRANLERVK